MPFAGTNETQRNYFIVAGSDAVTDDDDYVIAGGAAGDGNIGKQQTPAPQIMVFDRLVVRVTTNTSTGGTDSTLILQIGGVNTALVTTILQGVAAIYENITDRVTVAKEDLISENVTFGSLTTALTIRGRCIRGSY